MPSPSLHVERPQRWETRFGPEMTEADVDELLRIAPFHEMDASRFPRAVPLRGLLLNDARIVRCDDGDVILREGDYGSSAFLVIQGSVRVLLKNLPRRMLGRVEQPKRGLLATLLNSLRPATAPEVRRYGQSVVRQHAVATRRQRIFLQDIPQLLGPDDTVSLGPGEVFGEMAALARTPRTATVLCDGPTTLLEIRWQGLRELLRFAPAWKEHVDRLYRENSLRVHLRETPLFSHLSAEEIQQVADATQFATYGNFDWQEKFKRTTQSDPQAQIAAEPLIASEGNYPDGLLLIRSGFARLSVKCGSGHRTLAYLGKGDVFGLDELRDASLSSAPLAWKTSLRAIGYVDVLRVPTHIVEKFLLPQLRAVMPVTTLAASATTNRDDAAIETLGADSPAVTQRKPILEDAKGDKKTRLLEFLVDGRLNNGAQAMVIDLDRCTRCDDCVRACAATHDGNPRFNREGPKHENLMFTQACMHCADPVCMIGCPTGAIGRDVGSGNILINDETCIGCSTCANSCPYQNIRMVEIRDSSGSLYLDQQSVPILKATKCDLCTGQWGGPACQRACAHDALVRIDLRQPDSLLNWSQA